MYADLRFYFFLRYRPEHTIFFSKSSSGAQRRCVPASRRKRIRSAMEAFAWMLNHKTALPSTRKRSIGRAVWFLGGFLTVIPEVKASSFVL